MTSLSALIAQVQAHEAGRYHSPTAVCPYCPVAAPVLAAALKDALETLEYIATKAGRHGDDAKGAARSFLERHKEKTLDEKT